MSHRYAEWGSDRGNQAKEEEASGRAIPIAVMERYTLDGVVSLDLYQPTSGESWQYRGDSSSGS